MSAMLSWNKVLEPGGLNSQCCQMWEKLLDSGNFGTTFEYLEKTKNKY